MAKFSEQEKAVISLLQAKERTTKEIGKKVFGYTVNPRGTAGVTIARINMKSRAYKLGVKITSKRIGREKLYNVTMKKDIA